MSNTRALSFGTADLLVGDETLQVWSTPVCVFGSVIVAQLVIVGHLPIAEGRDPGPRVGLWAMLPDSQWQQCPRRSAGLGSIGTGHRASRGADVAAATGAESWLWSGAYGHPGADTADPPRPDGAAVPGIRQVRIAFELLGRSEHRVLDRADPR